MTDHLVVFIDVGGPKINEYVYDEHNIHDEVDDGEGVVVASVGVAGVMFLVALIEEEGSDVGREDCRVDDEDEDQPVPHGLYKYKGLFIVAENLDIV